MVWENRAELPFAWRILRDGVCDGCALGTSGLKDWTIPGTHLCMVRLELLRLNTASALDPSVLSDVGALAGRTSQELRALGRLPEPMLRRQGEHGFRVVSWDEALDHIAARLRGVDPHGPRSISPRAGSRTRCITRLKKPLAFSGPITSTTPPVSVMRRRPPR